LVLRPAGGHTDVQIPYGADRVAEQVDERLGTGDAHHRHTSREHVPGRAVPIARVARTRPGRRRAAGVSAANRSQVRANESPVVGIEQQRRLRGGEHDSGRCRSRSPVGADSLRNQTDKPLPRGVVDRIVDQPSQLSEQWMRASGMVAERFPGQYRGELHEARTLSRVRVSARAQHRKPIRGGRQRGQGWQTESRHDGILATASTTCQPALPVAVSSRRSARSTQQSR
jgi:hypothetical protein